MRDRPEVTLCVDGMLKFYCWQTLCQSATCPECFSTTVKHVAQFPTSPSVHTCWRRTWCWATTPCCCPTIVLPWPWGNPASPWPGTVPSRSTTTATWSSKFKTVRIWSVAWHCFVAMPPLCQACMAMSETPVAIAGVIPREVPNLETSPRCHFHLQKSPLRNHFISQNVLKGMFCEIFWEVPPPWRHLPLIFQQLWYNPQWLTGLKTPTN